MEKSKGSVAYNLYKKNEKKVIFAWNWNMSKRNKNVLPNTSSCATAGKVH